MGPDGVIELLDGQKLVLRQPGGKETVFDNLGNHVYVQEIAALADAVRQDRLPFASGEDGLAALRISLAALESAQTGRTVQLNM